MNTLGKIGTYTIFTVQDAGIEPGHQYICIDGIGLTAAYILAVLTGSEPHTGQETSIVDGVMCRMAPHDANANQRLHDLVDLCSDIWLNSPALAQIPIEGEGWDDEHA